MKKRIICSVLAIVLATVFALPASAAWQDGKIPLVDEQANFGAGLDFAAFFKDELLSMDMVWVEGKNGEGIDLGNSNKEQLRFDPTALGTAQGMTLSMWVYWRGARGDESDGGVLLFGLSSGSGHFKVVAKDGERTNGLDFAGGWYDQDVFCESATALPVGKWSMVTVTLDGSNMTLYLDGKQLAKEAQTVVPADLGIDLFRIGSSWWGPPTLNAVVDDAGLWTRALSASEVTAMYNATSGAPGSASTGDGTAIFAVCALFAAGAAGIALVSRKTKKHEA